MATVSHAVILAGGLSTRMRRDKALIPVRGIPMLERVAALASSLRPQLSLSIVGRTTPARWPPSLPATFLPDDARAAQGDADPARSAGPIIGLITALEHIAAPILLLPCDMPLLTLETLHLLLTAHYHAIPQPIATIAVSDSAEGPCVEPTLAVYTPEILPELRKMLRENRRSLYPLIDHTNVASWRVRPELAHEMLNVNDSASLVEAERILKQLNA